MGGNGPVLTSPVYASDEDLAIRALDDYASLAGQNRKLAQGIDGVFPPGEQWTLTSASINFQGQGVGPQNVIQLTGPKPTFQGGGQLFAIDTVGPNVVTLRMIGAGPGIGQPPGPLAGLTGVSFVINTFQAMLEDASYEEKSRLGVDEDQFFRSSVYMYNGVEDPYRSLRAACVLKTMVSLYAIGVRTDRGDWKDKLVRFSKEYADVLDRVQIQWGQNVGNDEEPSNAAFGLRLSR